MNSIVLAVIVFFAYIVAYHTYGKFLRRKIFGIDPKAITPAHKFRDGVDYVPTRREILFGHHYASIAGTGPIVGPALGVIWGWVPAILWVALGSIFIGAVHDFGAIVVSARHQGKSIGELCKDLISSTTRFLFLFLIFFELLIVIAVFAMIIGLLFVMYPWSVIPIWAEVPIAVLLGIFSFRKKKYVLFWSIVAVLVMYITVYIGTLQPLGLPQQAESIFGTISMAWVIILLIYAFFASILPVETLLQPRDSINAHQLIVALLALFIGLIVANKAVVAPAFVPKVPLTEQGDIVISFFPLIFVVIACGAISGFHSLVGSGTTIKQLDNERDAQFIGYGGMLLEGALATLVIISVVAGLGLAGWQKTYTSFTTAQGLGAKLGAFVQGGGNYLQALGLPAKFSLTVLAVFVVSFASTTLDTATRIQRYVISELSHDFKLPYLGKRLPATAIAVGSALCLALLKPGGQGALILWPLFGTVNQLLAGLALLVVTVYLAKKGKPIIYTAIPMTFMVFMTGWAMINNLINFFKTNDWTCLVIGLAVLLLEIWMIAEAITVMVTSRKPAAPTKIKTG